MLYTAIAPSVQVTGTLTKFVASLGLGASGWSNELVEDTEDVWPNMAAGARRVAYVNQCSIGAQDTKLLDLPRGLEQITQQRMSDAAQLKEVGLREERRLAIS